ncbi:MAG: Holliday junction resolvase RuvX [Puniceicoccaceae bacterium]
MRCLGIDYGEKRIGLAWGDELGVATPLPAATEGTAEQRLQQISRLIEERKVTDLVVGYPYNMDGTVGFKAQEVDAFIAILEERFSLPVHRVDERLTSHKVESDLGLSGKKERALRKTGIVDSGAATLILQDWLAMQVAPPDFEPFEDEED